MGKEAYDSWKTESAARRDERSTKDEEPERARSHAKKDRKRWCGGREGREHTPKAIRRSELEKFRALGSWLGGSIILFCEKCGKELETWYGGKQTRPEWVKEFLRIEKEGKK